MVSSLSPVTNNLLLTTSQTASTDPSKIHPPSGDKKTSVVLPADMNTITQTLTTSNQELSGERSSLRPTENTGFQTFADLSLSAESKFKRQWLDTSTRSTQTWDPELPRNWDLQFNKQDYDEESYLIEIIID